MDGTAALELVGIRKRLDGVAVLDGVDLVISAGTFVALVGASGSGKTTLLRTMNGLVRPDAGRVQVLGRDAAAEDGPALRRRIGYVIQSIGLMPHMTVGENIWLVPRLARMADVERDGRTAELLRLVSLPAALASSDPRTLSGGQAQRVGVARALAARPSLLLMDEPFGALDAVTREELGRNYRRLHDELGLTTVMVTHDLTEALVLADRVVVLDRGRIIADAAPAALVRQDDDPRVRALLEVPFRQAERLAGIMAAAGLARL